MQFGGRLLFVAALVAAAGCGGSRTGWPGCLRTLAGVQHVHVASRQDLAQVPATFDARRAAAVDFRDGHAATIVVSATVAGAKRVELFLRSSSLWIPGSPRIRALPVLRQEDTVLQWAGPSEPRRDKAVIDCARGNP
jgi:hypothetical protein